MSISIDEAERQGVTMTVTVEHPAGGWTIPVSAKQVAAYLQDKEAFAASHFGLSRAEYQLWLEWGGSVRCAGYTQKNTRCKNVVATPMQLSPQQWRALQGEYCAVHGGPGHGEISHKR